VNHGYNEYDDLNDYDYVYVQLDVDNALDLHVNLDNVYVVIDHNNDVDLHVDLDDVDL
jgi:hypothetical protein